MIRLFINGLAASAGGGLTYLRNVVPHLSRRLDVETTVLLSPSMRAELGALPNVELLEDATTTSAGLRFLHEQSVLPKLIRRYGADVLLCAGNFALWRSPVPQILLSRNSLYTSADFFCDVRARKDYSIWADTRVKAWFARQSIKRADITVAPSAAFAQELSQWSGREVLAVHHGFDSDSFTSDETPLPQNVQAKIQDEEDTFRLLFVSHYNYYRNFETLFRAMSVLRNRLALRKVKLFLTCFLSSGANPGSYRTKSAASLANNLRQNHDIVELGPVSYRSLHHLYRACHIYVTPAYAESFAHPLIEAMSSGLPIVASDLPVHREICGDAALYFPRFSPDLLAARVLEISEQPQLSEELSRKGVQRARDFSWSDHVERLIQLANGLVQAKRKQS